MAHAAGREGAFDFTGASEPRVAAAERELHLAKLAKDLDAGWDELAELIEARRDEAAMPLFVDLRELYTRKDAEAAFTDRFAALRTSLMRRAGVDRGKRAQPPPPPRAKVRPQS